MTWEKEIRLLNSLLRAVDSLARLAEPAVRLRRERDSEPLEHEPRSRSDEQGELQGAVQLEQGDDGIWRERKPIEQENKES